MSDDPKKEDDGLDVAWSEWQSGPYKRYARQYPQDFRPYMPSQLYNKMEPCFYDRYFGVLEKTGLLRAAADAIGCHVNHIQQYRREVPEFEEMVQAALDRYREDLLIEAHRRAVHGVPDPIIGGRNKDRVVGWRVRHSDRLLELFLKKHHEGFDKDKIEVRATLTDSHFDFSQMSRKARRQLRSLLHTLREDEATDRGEDLPEDPILESDLATAASKLAAMRGEEE